MTTVYATPQPKADGWYLVRVDGLLTLAEADVGPAGTVTWSQPGIDYDVWQHSQATYIIEVMRKLDIDELAKDVGVLRLPCSKAVMDVANERLRQQNMEGFSTEWDDKQYMDHELVKAAVCYALAATWSGADRRVLDDPIYKPSWFKTFWPWSRTWWKPKDPRRDLVRAAALLIAQIEQLDRQK